jgi:hypothetical protein
VLRSSRLTLVRERLSSWQTAQRVRNAIFTPLRDDTAILAGLNHNDQYCNIIAPTRDLPENIPALAVMLQVQSPTHHSFHQTFRSSPQLLALVFAEAVGVDKYGQVRCR